MRKALLSIVGVLLGALFGAWLAIFPVALLALVPLERSLEPLKGLVFLPLGRLVGAVLGSVFGWWLAVKHTRKFMLGFVPLFVVVFVWQAACYFLYYQERPRTYTITLAPVGEQVDKGRSFTGSVYVEKKIEVQGTLPDTLTFVGNSLNLRLAVAAGAPGEQFSVTVSVDGKVSHKKILGDGNLNVSVAVYTNGVGKWKQIQVHFNSVRNVTTDGTRKPDTDPVEAR